MNTRPTPATEFVEFDDDQFRQVDVPHAPPLPDPRHTLHTSPMVPPVPEAIDYPYTPLPVFVVPAGAPRYRGQIGAGAGRTPIKPLAMTLPMTSAPPGQIGRSTPTPHDVADIIPPGDGTLPPAGTVPTPPGEVPPTLVPSYAALPFTGSSRQPRGSPRA